MKKKVVVLKFRDGRKMYSKPVYNFEVETRAKGGMRHYNAQSYEVLDYAEPGDGGCWFCYTLSDDLLFDFEFDTNVHKECLEVALKANPDHPEAQLMAYLLEEEK